MRILVLHNRYLNRGGEDSVFESEAALLRNHGHEIIEYLEDNHELSNDPVLLSAANTIWSTRTQSALARLLREVKPEIAHFHNTFPRISAAAYYTCQRHGVPVVQTLHNYRLLCSGGLIRDGQACELCFQHPLMEAGIKHACYRGSRAATTLRTTMLLFHRLLKTYRTQVDTYIALTEFARNKFIEWGFPAKRIVVKPNFVDSETSVVNDIVNETRAEKGKYALFVGRLAAEKGLLTLLDAWEKVNGKLLIVGDGPLQQLVESRVESLDHVHYLGFKSNSEVMKLLADATVLIFPSQWYEGCPRSIVEAFANSVPVIASNLGGMSTIIEHGKNGLHFTPSDAEDLAAKANWLFAHPQELSAMRLNARHDYEHTYSVEKNYEQLIDIYRTTIDGYNKEPR